MKHWYVLYRGTHFNLFRELVHDAPEQAANEIMQEASRHTPAEGDKVLVFPKSGHFAFHVRRGDPTLEPDLYYRTPKPDDTLDP